MALTQSYSCTTVMTARLRLSPQVGREEDSQTWARSYPWISPPLLTMTSGPIGTRESAFVYALSAATISHAIARACTSGDLPGCSCGPVPGEPPGPGNRWGGCADNLSYGLLMGAKFSDAPMKVKKTGSQANKLMRLHNSEVGRQVTTHPTRPRWCACAIGWKGLAVSPERGGGWAFVTCNLSQLCPLQRLGLAWPSSPRASPKIWLLRQKDH